MMASKPKTAEAAELIAGFNPALIFRHCPATDPAVGGVDHTEFFLQLDRPSQHKVMAAKLEGEAAVHKALADAHTQIASILKAKTDHSIPEEFFHDILDEHFSDDEVDRQLDTAMNWGRYAEIFDYDRETERLILAEPLWEGTSAAGKS